ncbi:hypothetical protein MT881_002565, partial [Enterococcus faecium]|nr:hypothetical protein [Enterococcus faecium]
LHNSGEILSKKSIDEISNPIIFNSDLAIEAIKNTDIVSFEYNAIKKSGLGVFFSEEFMADPLLINTEGIVSESQLIYVLLSAVKNLEKRIEILEENR